MKWFLCFVLFLGCTGCGFVYANTMQHRIALLKALKLAWQTLQTRIHFFADPLQQAFIQSAALLPRDTSVMFLAMGQQIQKMRDVHIAMEQVLCTIEKEEPVYASLSAADKQALLSFASRLGKDSNTQQAAFDWLEGYFDEALDQGQQRMRTQARLYKASGLLMGLLLVVLFL